MSISLWNSLLVSSGVLGVSVVVSATASLATPSPRAYSTEAPTVTTPQLQRYTATKVVATLLSKQAPVPPATTPSKIADTKHNALESATMPAPANTTSPLSESQPDSDSSSDEDSPMSQVTNVSQFKDVQPSDWANDALSRIVQTYGCLQGYPDGTYRGNRALSRYEFAAGLNACLLQVEALIAKQPDRVSRKDFETLQRLAEDFKTELATLSTRINNLEARTTSLEQHNFSATTKLNGVAVFALLDVAAGDNALGQKIPRNTVLAMRSRLNFESSFTGQDLLRVRFQASTLSSLSGTSTFTPEGDLRFTTGAFSTGSNTVGIDQLLYNFPLDKKTLIAIDINAGASDDFSNTINPYLDGDGDTGAFSQFGTRNPIGYLMNNAEIGLKHQFNDHLEISLGYSANIANISTPGNGLFNGPYGALAQLTIKPTDQLTVGLTYVNAYNNDYTTNGSSGSNRANLRYALLNNPFLPATLQPFAGLNLPTSSNSYGIEASWQVNPKLVFGGWAGYTDYRTLASLVGTDGTVLGRGNLSIWNWAVTLALPDLGKKGSVAGLIVGMEPKVTDASNSIKSVIGIDRSTSLHVEGFYQYQLTDNIAVTPGLIWLTAPDHNNSNAGDVIGILRTTFIF